MLRRHVTELRPQADALEALHAEVAAMRRAVEEAESPKTSPRGWQQDHRPSGSGSVQAAVRSLSHGASSQRVTDLSTTVEMPSSEPIRISFNIVAPEPPLLPPGVSAELFRRQAETAALAQAEIELQGLEAHRDKLQAQVRPFT